MAKKKFGENQGFVLITTMLMMAVLLSLFSAYFFTTNIEIGTSRMSKDSVNGFYASEAGLNMRAEGIRQTFVGYNRPTGTTPNATNPCVGGNQGSGDYVCRNYTLGKQTAKTYIEEEPANPKIITIPAGERYQYLNAQEYRYTAYSKAENMVNRTTAQLELRFKSRLVPLFQFAAFYNKDLEILPGPTMTLNGPVHTNGDLYLNTDNGSPGLTIQGQVSTAGDLYRGRKNQNLCNSNPVKIYDPTNAVALIPSCSTRVKPTAAQITPYNGMIQTKVAQVEVPAPEVLDPTPGQVYWSHADLRLVLRLNSSGNPDTTNSSTAVEVRNADDSVNVAATNSLDDDTTNCSGTAGSPFNNRAVANTNTFYNNREGKLIRMLDVDLSALFNCLKRTNWFSTGKLLDDSTDGGLVFHLTVKGPNSASAANNYGVRVRNGGELRSNVSGAPTIKGLTIVSDQAVYVQGNYNSVNKKPAAFLSDAVNLLSNAFSDANSYAGGSPRALSYRIASNTTYNTAFLSGTDTTGGIEGAGGQNGAYNGGLENYPRLHEDWTGRDLTYRGSFVSLNRPRHQNGPWVYGGMQYTAPNRIWSYETAFNNAANLPPITPRFVYLRQELFVRDFER
ncbi:MAG: hypothetical protein J0M12_08085 [Deltaproteobacteria bacterium]|nr:hypothetical protein [Deltaproteobacteria bacterium]